MHTSSILMSGTSRRSKLSNTRFQLRDETLQVHEELERAFDKFQFFESEAGYKSWLTIMLRMHTRFAPLYDRGCNLMGLAPISSELLFCLKSDLGQDDVKYDPPRARAKDSECVGVVYVIEGSALGAKILRKRIDQNRSFSQNYLTRLTKDSRERWGRLTNELECNPKVSEMKFEDIRKGALEVFQAMKSDFQAEGGFAHG